MIFAIKDLDTELYYSKKSKIRLAADIDKAEQYAFIETARHHKTIAQHELAWAHLENKYKIDRWHLEITFKEFSQTLGLFKNLVIVGVMLNETKETD